MDLPHTQWHCMDNKTPKKITNAIEYMEKYYLLCNSCGNGSVPKTCLNIWQLHRLKTCPRNLFTKIQTRQSGERSVCQQLSALYLHNGYFQHKRNAVLIDQRCTDRSQMNWYIQGTSPASALSNTR